VAFYLMLALRTCCAIKAGLRPRHRAAEPGRTARSGGAGTVADVVPLDANNRILTWQG
jgi:single-stranded-DNA-specific exonuclease